MQDGPPPQKKKTWIWTTFKKLDTMRSVLCWTLENHHPFWAKNVSLVVHIVSTQQPWWVVCEGHRDQRHVGDDFYILRQLYSLGQWGRLCASLAQPIVFSYKTCCILYICTSCIWAVKFTLRTRTYKCDNLKWLIFEQYALSQWFKVVAKVFGNFSRCPLNWELIISSSKVLYIGSQSMLVLLYI